MPISPTMERGTAFVWKWGEEELTSEGFLDFVEDEVHERIIALERAADCVLFSLCSLSLLLLCLSLLESAIPSRPPLNLTMMALSMYLARSRMFSFLGLSV